MHSTRHLWSKTLLTMMGLLILPLPWTL
uniref:NADH dehydrogenase subunit 5 n=1 Tax=Romanomermis culicivorax TaxID=13658 RepID=A0A915HP65_ROMCU